MIAGTRKLLLTIDQGGVPPHIKPQLAAVVSAIEYGNWGEVTHSTRTAQQLEDAQEDLAEALEVFEDSTQDIKQAGQDLVEEVEIFCNSTEIMAVALVLKKAYEIADDPRLENEQFYLREQIDQVEEQFVKAVKNLKSYVNKSLKDFKS